jgi:uncharacterized protein (TIGR00730 family)
MKRVCIFCGSASGFRPVHAEQTRLLGKLLIERGLELVFGAGHIGLMGILADAVLAGGGGAIGVIPQSLVDRELAHGTLSELRVVETMHQRKALMADLSDAFLALPGGYGTLDELFEILTWAQLGIHTKPIGLLNSEGFFDPLLAWLNHAVAEGFLKPKHRALLQVETEPGALLDRLASWRPRVHVEKWIEPQER